MIVSPNALATLDSLADSERADTVAHLSAALAHLAVIVGGIQCAAADAGPINAAVASYMERASAGFEALARYGEYVNARHALHGASASAVAAVARVATPADKSSKLGALNSAMVSTAHNATAGLEALVGVLTGGSDADGGRILEIMGALDDHHERLKSILREAAEVASCTGSA
jgi:hypothetical protein